MVALSRRPSGNHDGEPQPKSEASYMARTPVAAKFMAKPGPGRHSSSFRYVDRQALGVKAVLAYMGQFPQLLVRVQLPISEGGLCRKAVSATKDRNTPLICVLAFK